MGCQYYVDKRASEPQIGLSLTAIGQRGFLGGEEVQTLVKFLNFPFPSPRELSQSSHASPWERAAADPPVPLSPNW